MHKKLSPLLSPSSSNPKRCRSTSRSGRDSNSNDQLNDGSPTNTSTTIITTNGEGNSNTNSNSKKGKDKGSLSPPDSPKLKATKGVARTRSLSPFPLGRLKKKGSNNSLSSLGASAAAAAANNSSGSLTGVGYNSMKKATKGGSSLRISELGGGGGDSDAEGGGLSSVPGSANVSESEYAAGGVSQHEGEESSDSSSEAGITSPASGSGGWLGKNTAANNGKKWSASANAAMGTGGGSGVMSPVLPEEDPGVSGDEEDEGEDYDDEEDWPEDQELWANTEANTGPLSPTDFLSQQSYFPFDDVPPNLISSVSPPSAFNPPNKQEAPATTGTPTATASASSGQSNPKPQASTIGNTNFSLSLPQRKPSTNVRGRRKSTRLPSLELKTSRPVFERNRCTVTISHGDPARVRKVITLGRDSETEKEKEKEGLVESPPASPKTSTENGDGNALKLGAMGGGTSVGQGQTGVVRKRGRKRTRKYLVASDLSDESIYAIEWTIGTVLRDGDECLLVTVMENDDKLDPSDARQGDKKEKIRNQKERQEAALRLAREATGLVQRTRLNITVTCQAIHAKNAKHMLIDMIDYLEPTMVIIGSRGLTQIKGMLLGSVSHYLIQKSSVPVMVARRRLKRPRITYKPKSALNRDARVPLEQAAIEKESNAAYVHEADMVQAQEKEKEKKDGKEHLEEKKKNGNVKPDDNQAVPVAEVADGGRKGDENADGEKSEVEEEREKIKMEEKEHKRDSHDERRVTV